jgi:hypothetical protein
MNIPFNLRWLSKFQRAGWLALINLFLSLAYTQAQPTVISSVPAEGATGVSTTAGVVITFSEAMNSSATTAMFYNESTFSLLTTTPVWSSGNTVLTCTPDPAFPPSTMILWAVSGQDMQGNSGGGGGTFTTGTGSGGGGTGGGGAGTNSHSNFVLGEAVEFDQTSASNLTPGTNAPYSFLADITLASNVDLSGISATLTLPGASVSNMFENPVAPEQFIFVAADTNQTDLDTSFPSGGYVFNVVSTTSNQNVTVNLPDSLAQPSAPHVANYAAAQSVNPAHSFTLEWDAFTGGTGSDFITVSVGTNFTAATVGASNALPSTATSVEIPGNVLQANTSYQALLGFFHADFTSNVTGYTTAAYRDSITQFTLITTGGGSVTGPVTLTNASWSDHALSFNVISAPGQNLTVQYNTKLGVNPWQTLIATNSATGTLQVTDSSNTGNQSVIYRAFTSP